MELRWESWKASIPAIPDCYALVCLSDTQMGVQISSVILC